MPVPFRYLNENRTLRYSYKHLKQLSAGFGETENAENCRVGLFTDS